MTPLKPEPVETAEHLVQMLAGEDLELNGFSVRQRDAMTRRIVARDAALVADAEARGARLVIDRLAGIAAKSRWVDDRNLLEGISKLLEEFVKGGADGG